MAKQDFTKIPLELNLSDRALEGNASALHKVTAELKRLETAVSVLTKDSVSFASTLRHSKGKIEKDLYVPTQYAGQAAQAVAFSQANLAKRTDEATEGAPVDFLRMGEASKVEIEQFSQKILASKREIAALKAEVFSLGGHMKESAKAGYYDISVPKIPIQHEDAEVSADVAFRSRIGAANYEARLAKIEQLSQTSPMLGHQYRRRLEDLSSGSIDPLRDREQETYDAIRKTKSGAFHKGDKARIRAYNEAKEARMSAEQAMGADDSGYDEFDEDIAKESVSRKGGNSLAMLKFGAKFYVMIKLLKTLVDVADKILSSITSLGTKVIADSVTGLSVGLSPLQIRNLENVERSRGVETGTTLGTIQRVQDVYGVTQNLHQDTISHLAPVLGGDLSEQIQMGVKSEALTPKEATMQILDAYLQRAAAGRSSLNLPLAGPDEAIRELITHLSQALGNDAAMLLGMMYKDMNNPSANPGLYKKMQEATANGASIAEAWYTFGMDALYNPSSIQDRDLEHVKEITRVLNEIKTVLENFAANFTVTLSRAFAPMITSARNASRILMSDEAKHLDIVAAREDTLARIHLGEKRLVQAHALADVRKEQGIDYIKDNLGLNDEDAAELYDIMSSMGEDPAAIHRYGGQIIPNDKALAARLHGNSDILTAFTAGYMEHGSEFIQIAGSGYKSNETIDMLERALNTLRENYDSKNTGWTHMDIDDMITGLLLSASRTMAELMGPQGIQDLLYDGGKPLLGVGNFSLLEKDAGRRAAIQSDFKGHPDAHLGGEIQAARLAKADAFRARGDRGLAIQRAHKRETGFYYPTRAAAEEAFANDPEWVRLNAEWEERAALEAELRARRENAARRIDFDALLKFEPDSTDLRDHIRNKYGDAPLDSLIDWHKRAYALRNLDKQSSAELDKLMRGYDSPYEFNYNNSLFARQATEDYMNALRNVEFKSEVNVQGEFVLKDQDGQELDRTSTEATSAPAMERDSTFDFDNSR